MKHVALTTVLLTAAFAGMTALAEPEKAAPETKNSTVVARVNGTDITRGELDKAIQSATSRMMMNGQAPQENQQSQMEKGALDELISEQLVIQKSAGIEVKNIEAQVDAKLAEIKKQFPNPEMFQEIMKSQGLDEATLRKKIAEGLRIEALIDRDVRSKITVTEADAHKFYDQNPEYFNQPAKVRASHILVMVPADADDKVKAEKKAAIDAARARVVGGEDFAKVAAEVSDCPSKKKGGDLDFFGAGQMVKPFEEAAFRLKEGEVSDVVTTQFGYHIIKKTGAQEATVTPFEKEQVKITQFLSDQKSQEALPDYIKTLRAEAKVEILLK
jgi:peptidyl-prolyl cis-trans isomerase C